MAGLYLHIPFCERKCIYCNFYSVEQHDGRDRFVDALVREIDMRADALDAGVPGAQAPQEYDSIFFGGGTPSLLSPEEMGTIMERLRRRFALRDGAEITMECNPGALTIGWLEGYRDLGVNRLSFGVQSFDDAELQFLSRIHSADEARRTISAARKVFENVSLDLIFALPHQTLERWRANLTEGIELGTAHFSAYSLVFEEGTKLNALRREGSVRPAPDDLEADMYDVTMATLGASGFEQYEVSNFARPGRACRHNLGYWERRSYISFGPSAHSFQRAPERSTRWANVSSLTAYLLAIGEGNLPVVSVEEVTPALAIEEMLMLGLRSSGIMLDDLRDTAGRPLEELTGSRIARLIDDGYAVMRDDRDGGRRLCMTRKGFPFADRFALELLTEAAQALPDLFDPDAVSARGRSIPASALTLPVVTAA